MLEKVSNLAKDYAVISMVVPLLEKNLYWFSEKNYWKVKTEFLGHAGLSGIPDIEVGTQLADGFDHVQFDGSFGDIHPFGDLAVGKIFLQAEL